MLAKVAILILLAGCQRIHAQWHFPDDPASNVQSRIGNISELRGTPFYEQYVNAIIANGITKMTLAIDKTLENNVSNVVFAPVSIAAVLALLMLGSGGSSFRELVGVMGLATGVDIEQRSQLVHEQFGRLIGHVQRTSGFQLGSQVNFATSLFVQAGQPVRAVYRDTAHAVYRSEVQNLDFRADPQAAQRAVNAWVEERTAGKIRRILAAPPSPDTRVILASAMYFKAEWERPFFDGATKSRPWYTNGRDAKSDTTVQFMANAEDFPYYKDDLLNAEIIGFPYKGNLTTMYVVKPVNSDKNKLHDLSSKLTPADVERLVSNVRYTPCLVLFPRMTIDSTIDLTSSLKHLGVRSVFNPGQANLALLASALGEPEAEEPVVPLPTFRPLAAQGFSSVPIPQASYPQGSGGPLVPMSASYPQGPGTPLGSMSASYPQGPGGPQGGSGGFGTPLSTTPAPNRQGAMPTDSDGQPILIFSRMREDDTPSANCTGILNSVRGVETCEDVVDVNGTATQKVVYKKFGDKVGRRLVKRRIMPRSFETLDTIRQRLDRDPNGHLENPGLYVDQVIHKVYMDITESGTEAAAATISSLSRDGGRTVFRADTPFLFFIRHEETKIIFFWGAVNTPTPNTPHPAS